MAKIYYARVDEFWRKEQKYEFLEQQAHRGQVGWQMLTPDRKYTWLTEGMNDEFDNFISIGTREAKAAKEADVQTLFKVFSLGLATNRDEWAYDFGTNNLEQKIKKLIDNYNFEVLRLSRAGSIKNIDNFTNNDPAFIKWTDRLKEALQQGVMLTYDPAKIQRATYRPFVKRVLYFDHLLNQRRYRQTIIFPKAEVENRAICIGGYGRKNFAILMVEHIPDLNFYADPAQCFPFYTYDEDGGNRRENITDWALAQFQAQYGGQPRPDRFSKPVRSDDLITKRDIFHYIYALLHHPTYRETYAANLRRELPRIPLVEGFWAFAQAGAALAELHVNYEQQPEYPLQFVETPGEPLNWRVEKMRLSKDKTQLKYNNFLTLAGIPPAVFEYKLGNRSALDWVIDQYQVSTDTRSGIVNDPNNPEDEQYIVKLIGQVITVSLETMKIVKGLPELKILD